MTFFTSTREKHLWLWSFLVFVTIISTLFIGRPLANQLRDQNIQAIFFLLGMILVGAAVVNHGLRWRPGKIEISVLLGIVAVYVMFFFRLGAPERSHLIEYSVLAIFIHEALIERKTLGKSLYKPALMALVITFLVGVADEYLQFFLPDRVFDPEDILFNGLAAGMAIGFSALLGWIHRRLVRSN